MTDKTTSTFPVDLTDEQLNAVAESLGLGGFTPNGIRQKLRSANDALERNAARNAEWDAFAEWWSDEWAACDSKDIAKLAWLKRADIHRDYEARVEADTDERMDNTSAEMNALQARAVFAETRLAEMTARVAYLEQLLPVMTVGIDVQADGVHVSAPPDDDHADPEPFLRALRAEAAADRAATVIEPPPAAHPPPTQAEIAGTFAVLREVAAERVRQHAKWGRQEHPLGLRDEERSMAASRGFGGGLRIGLAPQAKAECEGAFDHGYGTYAHILVEEVAEAIDAPSIADMRTELIQVAAVAVQMVEAIDRMPTEAPGDA